MAKIKVLIVEDHPLYRDGLCQALRRESDIQIVGQTADGNTAVKLAVECRPDIILMDLRIPNGGDGLEVMGRIRRRADLDNTPPPRIVVLTGYADATVASAVKAAGADGFLSKSVDKDKLLLTVKTVVNSPPFAKGKPPLTPPDYWAVIFPELTHQHRRTLCGLLEGYTVAEIALCIGCVKKSVQNYIPLLRKQLAVDSTTALIQKARERIEAYLTKCRQP